jgi:hypothetical protein
MSTIQTIFQRFGPSWLALHPQTPIQLRRTIEAITACRRAEMGSVCYDCQDCHCRHRIPASCGNRHCPQCQGRKALQWLQRQVERQLPGPHFMLTFTVPEALRAFLMGRPRFGYDCLFRASADAMKVLVADPRHLGAEHPGFFGVLHTWGRQLQYHPHIHYVVPAGALCRDGRWQCSRNAFFLPVRALSRLVRGKFRALVQQAELIGQVPAEVWRQDWNVHCQAVPSAEATLRYLAPYVFKVAISDQRVLKLDGDQVHIRWYKVGSNRPRVLVLHAHEFIRRFLQHVLPKGFMKVRYYGFLAPSTKIPLDQVELAIHLAHALELPAKPQPRPVRPPPVCSQCGGLLRFHARLRAVQMPAALATGPPGP